MNNVKPRTREEREAMRNKEAIEKTRINDRVGPITRFQEMRDILHNSDPKSTLFCPENERFDKDFAVHDRRERELDNLRKAEALENHRIQIMERETQKWNLMENQDRMAEEKRKYHADVLQAGKRNSNGLAFNPITLEYDSSRKGEELRGRDEDARLRNLLRANNLDKRSNCGYNVLTGEERSGVQVPPPLRGRFDKAAGHIDQQSKIRPPF
eukprot:TRINITY_DN2770_c0_g2_i4.p1 TRINITY_DN2770_c0_g2~~TRINITY_DN2770_c0_g2_i4.p1  ORF type:complete len:212 (+),score=46.81 TRINITY_DN2770_c0_g2_i4:329-964(+)